MDRFWGVALIIISAVSFGAMPIFARLAYEAGTDPISLLFLRFSIGAPCMLLILKFCGTALPRGRLLIILFLMGAVGYVGQSFCYFTALTMVSAGLVGLLLYLYPAFVTVLAAVFFKAPVTRLQIAALSLSLAGTFMTLGVAGGGKPLGILLGISAPVIYSLYIITGSRIIPQVGALASSSVVMFAAAAVFGAMVAMKGFVCPKTWEGWLSVGAISLLSTVLAMVAFFGGLKRLDASNASILSTLEPAVTLALAYSVLDEPLTLAKLFGGGMIVAAVILLAWNPSRSPSIPGGSGHPGREFVGRLPQPPNRDHRQYPSDR